MGGNQGLGLVAGREQWGEGGPRGKGGGGVRQVEWSQAPFPGAHLSDLWLGPQVSPEKEASPNPSPPQVSEGPAPFWESLGCHLLKTHACLPSPPDGRPQGYGSVQDKALSPSPAAGASGAPRPERGSSNGSDGPSSCFWGPPACIGPGGGAATDLRTYPWGHRQCRVWV